MKHKLVLVNTWMQDFPPLGLGYLASYLEKKLGFSNIEIVDTNVDVVAKIVAANPTVVGFTASTPNYFKVQQYAWELREAIGVPTMVGGPHITSLPRTLASYFDVGVVGEGEGPIVQLMEAFMDKGRFDPVDLALIPNLVYHSDGGVVMTPKADPIIDLDEIPFPHRGLLDMSEYLIPRNVLANHEVRRGSSIITSRGCPYKCIYCQIPQLFNDYRVHSPGYVADEIEILVDEYGAEAICIADDMFFLNAKRVGEVAEELQRRNILDRVQFLADGRANIVNKGVLDPLKAMNVVTLALGFESGSERMLKYLKKDSVTIDMQYEAVRLCNEYGIGIYGQFMMGSPTETREDMMATHEFIRTQDITTCHLSWTTPLPGTELWKICTEKGLVSEEIDWKLLNCEPQADTEEHFYVNEVVPRDEFVKIFQATKRMILMKHLRNTPVKDLFKKLFTPGKLTGWLSKFSSTFKKDSKARWPVSAPPEARNNSIAGKQIAV